MPIYRTVHRLEGYADGRKTITQAGKEVELSEAEAAALGDAVELVIVAAAAPEPDDQGEASGAGKSGKKV